MSTATEPEYVDGDNLPEPLVSCAACRKIYAGHKHVLLSTALAIHAGKGPISGG